MRFAGNRTRASHMWGRQHTDWAADELNVLCEELSIPMITILLIQQSIAYFPWQSRADLRTPVALLYRVLWQIWTPSIISTWKNSGCLASEGITLPYYLTIVTKFVCQSKNEPSGQLYSEATSKLGPELQTGKGKETLCYTACWHKLLWLHCHLSIQLRELQNVLGISEKLKCQSHFKDVAVQVCLYLLLSPYICDCLWHVHKQQHRGKWWQGNYNQENPTVDSPAEVSPALLNERTWAWGFSVVGATAPGVAKGEFSFSNISNNKSLQWCQVVEDLLPKLRRRVKQSQELNWYHLQPADQRVCSKHTYPSCWSAWQHTSFSAWAQNPTSPIYDT